MSATLAGPTARPGTFDEYLGLGMEVRAEWKNGVIHFRDRAASEEHNLTAGFLYRLCTDVAEETDAGRVYGDGMTMRLSETSARIPDVSFFRKDALGKIRKTYAVGAANLAIEIVSPSSQATDRSEKFDEYEAAGVEEYWLIDPERRTAEFFRQEPGDEGKGRFTPVYPDAEGWVGSRVLPGFRIKIAWLWERPRLRDAVREMGSQ